VTDLSYDFGILRIGAEFLLGCALHAVARTLNLSSAGSTAALAATGVATLGLMHVQAPDLLVVLAMGGLILAAAAALPAAEHVIEPGDDPQAVMDRAAPGDRLVFRPGLHRHRPGRHRALLSVDKSIHIELERGATLRLADNATLLEAEPEVTTQAE
jgi:hypothetical protein